MSRISGTVEWFDLNKGFGVVRGEDGKTYRFRWRDILEGRLFKGLKENDKVEIEPATDKSGRDVANDVVLTQKATYYRLSESYTSSDMESNIEQDVD